MPPEVPDVTRKAPVPSVIPTAAPPDWVRLTLTLLNPMTVVPAVPRRVKLPLKLGPPDTARTPAVMSTPTSGPASTLRPRSGRDTTLGTVLTTSDTEPLTVMPGIEKTFVRSPLNAAVIPAGVMRKMPDQWLAVVTVTKLPSESVRSVTAMTTSAVAPVVRRTRNSPAPRLCPATVTVAFVTTSSTPGSVPAVLTLSATVPLAEKPDTSTVRSAVTLPDSAVLVMARFPCTLVARTRGWSTVPKLSDPFVTSTVSDVVLLVMMTSACKTWPAIPSTTPVPLTRSGALAAKVIVVVTPPTTNVSSTAPPVELTSTANDPERVSPGTPVTARVPLIDPARPVPGSTSSAWPLVRLTSVRVPSPSDIDTSVAAIRTIV